VEGLALRTGSPGREPRDFCDGGGGCDGVGPSLYRLGYRRLGYRSAGLPQASLLRSLSFLRERFWGGNLQRWADPQNYGTWAAQFRLIIWAFSP
jgi:hypothetical protein